MCCVVQFAFCKSSYMTRPSKGICFPLMRRLLASATLARQQRIAHGNTALRALQGALRLVQATHAHSHVRTQFITLQPTLAISTTSPHSSAGLPPTRRVHATSLESAPSPRRRVLVVPSPPR